MTLEEALQLMAEETARRNPKLMQRFEFIRSTNKKKGQGGQSSGNREEPQPL